MRRSKRAMDESVTRMASLLGLTWPATAAEIEIAFRKKALVTHPDQGGTDQAMDELVQARRVLLQKLSGDRFNELFGSA